MTKISVIRCVLALLLAGYAVFALVWANSAAARATCDAIDVQVIESPASRNFVTAEEVRRLLKEWGLDRTGVPMQSVDTRRMEENLEANSNIEHALAERLANGHVRLTVEPMQPVARIFDSRGRSYYINRQGKKLTANARYRLDVPVITGDFPSGSSAVALLPLVERIARDSAWNAIVSHVAVEKRTGDVLLVPMIRGHVINIGDPDKLDDKLDRVMLMYHKVMPVKGWNYYDTISVKWAGQVVATRRQKSIPEPLIRFDQAGDEIEVEDVNSMLVSVETDTVGTGR